MRDETIREAIGCQLQEMIPDTTLGIRNRLRRGPRPNPDEIPLPTYWPVTMSLGITFIFWGIATTYIISGVGLLLFVVALAGWIGDMRHEHEH